MTTTQNQKGKVKWFSEERGYGYITNNENKDLYFGVKDVFGADLPERGDVVSFKEYVGKEGTEAATDIRIVHQLNPNIKKIDCPSCKRLVEPKPWYYGGSDYTVVNIDLLCPFCGFKLAKKGGGFNRFAKIILFVFIASLTFVFSKII